MNKIFGTAIGGGLGGTAGLLIGAVLGLDMDSLFDIPDEALKDIISEGSFADNINASHGADAIVILEENHPEYMKADVLGNNYLPELTDEAKTHLEPQHIQGYEYLKDEWDLDKMQPYIDEEAMKAVPAMTVSSLVGAGAGAIAGYNMSGSKENKL